MGCEDRVPARSHLQGRLAEAVQGVRMHQFPVQEVAHLLHVATGRCATQPVADADFFQEHSGHGWSVKATQPQTQSRSGLGKQQPRDPNTRDSVPSELRRHQGLLYRYSPAANPAP